MIGIYKITSPSGRIYIGQSVNIERRLNSYKREHAKNKKCTILYKSLIKYGGLNHKYEVIKECEIVDLNKWERQYQDLFKVIDGGLNCTLTKAGNKSGKASKQTLINMSIAQKGNQNWLGKRHSDEAKAKISKAQTGRVHSKEVNLRKGRKGCISPMKGLLSFMNPLSKRINQLSSDGKLIKTWHSAQDAVREGGFSASGISLSCSNNINKHKGFKWEFANEVEMTSISV